MSPASKAQQKAVSKYMKANYDVYQVRMPKGRKEEIKEHADKLGESVNGFINRAITETIDRDDIKAERIDRDKFNQMTPEERGYRLPWEKPQEEKPKPKKIYHVLPDKKPDPTKF